MNGLVLNNFAQKANPDPDDERPMTTDDATGGKMENMWRQN
jgi:hypothetical protein